MIQNIVFIRHAHRDQNTSDSNNGISLVGKAQAANLVEQVGRGLLPHCDLLLSSPKRRCLETLEPLAKHFSTVVQIDMALDERGFSEPRDSFVKRIDDFLRTLVIQDAGATIYLCSHGDWLPEAVVILAGAAVEFSNGQAIVCTKATPGGDGWRLQ
jgi:broad specificity phosphatase PhoE